MIADVAWRQHVTPANVAGGLLVLGIIVQILIRTRFTLRIKKIGGQQLPKLAHDPFTALSWLYPVAKAQSKNELLTFFDYAFDTVKDQWNPNACEINVTGGQRYLISREPEHIKTILTGKFADYGKGEEFHRVWAPFLGDSIFTTDHQQWQDSRNLIRPMFIKNRVSDLNIFDHWTQVMMKQFPKSGETFDMQDFMYRLTIDVITDFLLGHGVNSLENPRNEFVQAFGSTQRWQMMLTVLIPIEKIVPRGPYLKGIKVIDKFVQPFIDRTLELSPAELEKLSKSDSEFTFLHSLANYTRDKKVIRDQLIAVLLAGRDTTAATLSWLIYEISHYPKTWQKLRAEVLEHVGPTEAPTYDDLKKLKYLNNALNETLRMYPAVPFNVRYALVDTTLPSCKEGVPDVPVVAGDAVFYSTMAMQRREDLYPETSPEFAPVSQFSPERWEKWQPKPWQYVPFNGGPRICVGQNFALTEMAFVMVRLAQKYARIEYRGDWHAQIHKVEIVGCPGNGVTVAMFEDEKSG